MFTPELLKSVAAQIVEKCDVLDGVKDGLLEDPRRCNVDIAGLAGLSDGQRAALRKIYAETSGKGGATYPARPVGGEGEVDSWPAWITGGSRHATPRPQVWASQWLRTSSSSSWFHDPSWDYSGYDVANARKDARLAATFMNATNPDLDAFRAKSPANNQSATGPPNRATRPCCVRQRRLRLPSCRGDTKRHEGGRSSEPTDSGLAK